MRFSVRRRRREAVALLAFALSGFVACEDAAEFTEPETVAFTAIAIDKASVRPREGERLTVGPTAYDVEVDVRYQNLPASSVIGVWVETHDSVTGQTFRWEGDLLEQFSSLSGPSGTVSFSGAVQLPEVSPFCGSYDYARILVVAFPGGDPPPNEAYRDEVFFEVSGSDWSGPCVSNVFALPGTGALRIGEPIVVYGRGLPGTLAVSLPGAQQDDNVWPAVVRPPETLSLLPVPNDGYVIAFVPVGAETGRLRAFAGGDEVRYGPEGVTTLAVSSSMADFLEPNNSPAGASDSIYFDLLDPFGVWGAYGFNPSLTLAGADQSPDALAPDYGEGDWLYLVGVANPAVEIDACINVASHLGDLDDIDVFVYDTAGLIVAESATPSGTEAVRVDGISSTDVYWVWVTPWLAGFNSAAGGYSYEVGECAASTGTAIARPDGPRRFFGASSASGVPAAGIASRSPQARDHSVRMPARGQARVPLSQLRVRGGER